MNQVVFYEDANGVSELWNFLDDLLQRSTGNKDARIQHKQIVYYIELLQKNGTRLPETITKNIIEDIWELRPGDNRVFYFYFRDNTFVLLHHFRKKSQKTPQREIDRAIAERDDFLSRKGGKKT
ncbi:MAG: type II toxin-antitoxin system RelE/ParE family toxin [Eubacteriales bacterium]|nr:type II toxin-antitoxin system RelE/ParE family toxin [Eubacteriales bacterium]